MQKKGMAESTQAQALAATMARPGPVVGIVAEYNPFHLGHADMIGRLRQAGAETIVCAMSGDFVQRAEPAALPAHLRARAAVLAGADLVLRLPLGWATASAERFARGGVQLLAALGCVDTLAFGAEDADTQRLLGVAAALGTEEFKVALAAELSAGVSFAAARAAATERVLPGAAALLASPNNILGIEYCKALIDLPRGPAPLALARRGAAHDGTPAGGVASASWLRRRQGWAGWKGWVPPACLPVYRAADEQGALIDRARWELALLARLRGLSAEQFARCDAAGEGLEARLAAAAGRATCLEELYSLAKTKRFAHSRVRRLALQAGLGIPAAEPQQPPFTHVLAATPAGLALLRRAKHTATLPVSTSLARLAKTGPEALETARLEANAAGLYALCQKTPAAAGGIYTQPAFIAAVNSL